MMDRNSEMRRYFVPIFLGDDGIWDVNGLGAAAHNSDMEAGTWVEEDSVPAAGVVRWEGELYETVILQFPGTIHGYWDTRLAQ